jgi:hypothetical protein
MDPRVFNLAPGDLVTVTWISGDGLDLSGVDFFWCSLIVTRG